VTERRIVLSQAGYDIYNLARELFPICRSITGDGARETLRVLGGVSGAMKIHEIPSGTKVFDWTVPKEWNVRDAYIECPDGARIAEFKKNNLHLMGYSMPVNKTMPLAALQNHIYSLPEQPDAIPYVTSYDKERFGFCLSHAERAALRDGEYRVFVDSDLKNGSLAYGEIIIPGEEESEIFFSSNICHPSMANNELSGPCVAAYLARWITEAPRRFTYRFVFVPETIGSITYLSRNLDSMKRNVIAGFSLSCIGDAGHFSHIASRYGDTLADRAARVILKEFDRDCKTYSFLNRGSDERQYCAPGVDLPLVCITRTKFGRYPEYHTSADNLNFITPDALGGSFDMLRALVEALEANRFHKTRVLCEPQLSPRGLYPTVSDKHSGAAVRMMMNFIAYCDGRNDLFGISELTGAPVSELIPAARKLSAAGVID
jgi:aminopeptidase-like protein